METKSRFALIICYCCWSVRRWCCCCCCYMRTTSTIHWLLVVTFYDLVSIARKCYNYWYVRQIHKNGVTRTLRKYLCLVCTAIFKCIQCNNTPIFKDFLNWTKERESRTEKKKVHFMPSRIIIFLFASSKTVFLKSV